MIKERPIISVRYEYHFCPSNTAGPANHGMDEYGK